MNTEEKAKAYDEALERARMWRDKSGMPADRQGILDDIFPQLKESEDEKIRQKFIKLVKMSNEVGGFALHKWEADEMLAWLEKQGDNNNEDADILQRFSFYSYKDEPNVLYLSNVFVNEEYRNKGIGTKILKIADEVSTYLKCNSIRLKTENGSNAESLYRKNGYKTLKEEDNQIWLEKQGKETNWKPSKEEMDVLYGLAYITNQYDEHKEEVITRLYQDLKREFFNGSSYENMFPTNTSTEDDVRRRSTIQVLEYARSLDNYNQYGKADIDKNIAWLEKQGEQKTSVVDFKAKDWYVSKVDGKIYNAKFMEKTPTNQARKLEIEKAAMSATGIIKQEEWFIKGAEWSDKNPSYICSEKQNEQKPTDKIEPKFHEGEWIVWKDKCYKVNYNGCGYELVDQDGLSTSLEYDTIDENAHIWDVTTDAKAGDVLASELCDSIILFKGIKDYNIDFYCDYDFSKIDIPGDRFTVNNGQHYGNVEDSKDFYPATKEQRDTLLKAMADAGYTFDFGKKELKKIEKISQRMVSAESKEALYDKPTDEEMKELLRTEYEKGKADTIAEMEKNWSEEDEDTLAAIIAIIRKQYNGTNIEEKKYYNVLINWLKSLKDRYTWRPSNEQIDTLEHFVRSIGESGYASPYDNNTKLLYSLLEQLKKLKA